jgi:hypothetical protein
MGDAEYETQEFTLRFHFRTFTAHYKRIKIIFYCHDLGVTVDW